MHEDFVRFFFDLDTFVRAEEDVPIESGVRLVRVLNDPEHGLPMMMPVMVSQRRLEEISETPKEDKVESLLRAPVRKMKAKAKVFGFFPANQHLRTNATSSLAMDQMIPLDPKSLFEGHRIKVIERFEPAKIMKISEYVKEHGVVSFIMEDTKAAYDFLSSIHNVKRFFKHTSLYNHNHTGNSRPMFDAERADDILVTSVTFFDLPMAVPVYNFRKADGMAIAIRMYFPKTSKAQGHMYLNEEDNLVVSKYPDNILRVDGVKINRENFIGSDLTKHMKNILEGERLRRKEIPKLIEKAKKEEEKKDEMRKKMEKSAKKAKSASYTGGYVSASDFGSSTTSTSYFTASDYIIKT